MAHNLSKIETLLCEYNYFRECIILDIHLRDFGTTVEVLMNNIWDEKQLLRPNIAVVSPVRITFTACQEFLLANSLNSAMLQDMAKLNWGINEIASLHVEDALNYTSRYSALPQRFLHALFVWEGERRIDIICRDIAVTEE